jgi:hypothetical protein
VDAELEALQTSAIPVQDLVLGNVDRPSSLATSQYMVVKEVKGRINTAPANGVPWGTRSMLVATLSHFWELKFEQELLGFGRNADLIDDEVDALWPLVSVASNSLASLVPSSFACDPSDDVEEE